MEADEEVGAEREEVEEKTFQCSDCEKNYSFLHKLQQHQTWSCKKKEVEKIEINFARRPLSSNVSEKQKCWHRLTCKRSSCKVAYIIIDFTLSMSTLPQ